MPERADLLLEIGTEELPAKGLRALSAALGHELALALERARLGHGVVESYATPRRLAVLIREVAARQPDRARERRGPALSAAFDARGEPTRAALGFARSAGVALERLERLETDQGQWLVLRTAEPGQPAEALLGSVVNSALERLSPPRTMRWRDLELSFVRPVHWVVLLFGDAPVAADILGVRSGHHTRGHRFHAPQPIALDSPADYLGLLRREGRVIADLDARCASIAEQVEAQARLLGGGTHIEPGLLEEAAALVEWPVALAGGFDRRYLALPAAVLIATMQGHQRYFPVYDADGSLLPHFITVSNIESTRPETVRAGNERVIRPRLADAAFFYEADLERGLEEARAELDGLIFQEGLGTMAEKCTRLERLAATITRAMGCPESDAAHAARAGALAKFDLVTHLVREFPELQGTMGHIYASLEGEPEAVALAIEESYLPRFAGDALPRSAAGRALAIAEKIDTLAGCFGIGQAPSGDKDPFGLRRAALGCLRILIEGELALDLPELLEAALDGFAENPRRAQTSEQLADFMWDRLRAYFGEQGVSSDVYAAVLARRPPQPLDFANRIRAVQAFCERPEAESLAAANKRIRNILRQSETAPPEHIDPALFEEAAERALAERLGTLRPRVEAALEATDYQDALLTLAALRDPVDAFFDTVRVMSDEAAIRANRLALLASLSDLFLLTADLSLLRPGASPS